ncbi:hypothetical protein F5Y00DRAFT_201305 [Daldinia vernicosa]|uniref:uncharacterized protein n=1 Tax=Daldinia vernicosa TaxID=114800 RepID=UPI0020074FFD|nr:uncharacterized protein F5Y00DRAFT_201305 [Daldinia vernicosa]KAI0844327.1 hypothetical protein F5Y00DRAFT_201305 [Daldinia vernicosa]
MLAAIRGEQVDRYTVSVVLWGGEKAAEDSSGHVAIAVHSSVSQPITCHLHHARCPDQVRFIYESRPEQKFDADPAPRGRCDIRADLSAEEASVANSVLAHFGTDETQLPFYGEGNCHNWAAGAIGALEKAGLAQSGDGERWAGLIGKGPLAMQTSWIKDAGRQWVSCEKFNQPRPDVIDAKWGDNSGGVIAAGRVSRDRVEHLQKLLQERNSNST